MTNGPETAMPPEISNDPDLARAWREGHASALLGREPVISPYQDDARRSAYELGRKAGRARAERSLQRLRLHMFFLKLR